MESRTEMSVWKRWAAILGTILAMTVFLAPIAQAADEFEHRVVFHVQKVETMEVGDVPGHVVGVADLPGLIFVTNGPFSGEVGIRKAFAYFDLVKGKGTVTAYGVYTFKDGSTHSFKATGTIAPADGGGSAYEGTWEMTGGTGRFAGMKGKGPYKGERPGPPGTSAYIDSKGTIGK